MIDAAVVASGLLAWWGCVCRVGQMCRRLHRMSAMLWHWAAGSIALACVALTLMQRTDVHLALGTTLSLLAYLSASLRDWEAGPPGWTLRPVPATTVAPVGADHAKP